MAKYKQALLGWQTPEVAARLALGLLEQTIRARSEASMAADPLNAGLGCGWGPARSS
jgi:hypothetical protein